MTDWTQRYLDAVLRSIPRPKRDDVERELRSSITDAIEERTAAGEDPASAERAVLEGLGSPAQLASGYTGRPNYLIGPELFPIYRHVVPRLVATAMPIVALIIGTVTLADGGSLADAIAAGIGQAISVGIQFAFWSTLAFIFIERADAARQARTELVELTGRWKLEHLPEPAPGRVTMGETFSEIVTNLLGLGGLLFLSGLSTTDAAGTRIPLFDPSLTDFWFPVLIGVLGSLAVVQAVAYVVGRWTIPLAILFSALSLALAVPVAWLALRGTLVNPAYAAELGWPWLAQAGGPVMLSIAVGVVLVTAWEIVSVFLRARGARPLASLFGFPRPSA